MSKWLISVPVWGEQYVRTFVEYAAPAIRSALQGFDHQVRFLIHTDQPDAIQQALSGAAPIEFASVPNQSTYTALQYSHGDAINRAEIGERVTLLNADLIVSGNLFKACEQHMNEGKRAVVLVGIRTAMGHGPPPVGEEPRKLLQWAWEHRHQIIRDLEWGAGGSMIPTNIFFARGDSVVMHGFHLHPVAIVKEKDVSFISTIDGDLLDHFDASSIHIVTNPDDIAMLEMSPPDRRFPVRGYPSTASDIANSMTSRASIRHRWLFESRIVVIGDGADQWDVPVAAEILQYMQGRYT